ncbi:MAG: tyrosine-type recombinase/integrase [Verrucomicrobiia bacterium]
MKTEMPKTKSGKSSWPPIVPLKYPSGKTAFQVACVIQGERIREAYPTKAEAETRAAQIRQMVDNEGAAAFALPTASRVEASKCIEKLKPFNVEITEAVDYYVEHVLAFRDKPTVNATIAEIVKVKESNGRRQDTIENFRIRAGRFAETFGERRLATITPEEIRAWLTDKQVHHGRELGPVSRVNYLVAVGNVFEYGVKHGYCDRNPVKLVDRPSRENGDVHFLSVEQVVSLLLHAEKYGLVPYVALGVFAGLRPEKELRALDWSKVSLPQRTIRIDASLAKTRQRRVIEIDDALVAYLSPYAKRRGLVVDMGGREFRTKWEQCRKDAGIQWHNDVLRHSFATYHLAAFNDIGRLSLQMGNSPHVIHSAYKGLVSKADAERFWALRPAADASEKIVAMKAVNQ